MVDSAIHSELFLNADDEIVDLTPRSWVEPLGLDAAAWFTVAMGVVFVVAYPWILSWHTAQFPTSALFDFSLAVCWLAPLGYIVSGMVKASSRSNQSRQVLPGLAFAGAAVVAQLVALAIVRPLFPPLALQSEVLGLTGDALVWSVPVLLYATGAVVSALAAAWMPKVVPGKFARVIAPQLGCLSVIVAGIFLPTWGGLALFVAATKWGFAPLWIDLAIAFLLPVFAIFWFWPED